jgi:uncharacterized protein with FMN-binding domain
VAILVVGWQAGSAVLTSTTASTSPGGTASGSTSRGATGSGLTSGSTGSTSGATGSTGSTGSTTDSTTTAASADGTYDGDTVTTRYGDVQVQVTISGGSITEVSALQLTDKERKSVQISNRAAPMLRSEVLASQSADVSTIGGATYTSDAYLTSLQSALDQAGL